jgi:hypothetical protein
VRREGYGEDRAGQRRCPTRRLQTTAKLAGMAIMVGLIGTARAPAASIPDGRAWELVSPPDKLGAQVEALTFNGGVIQAAVKGDAISYLMTGPTQANVPGNGEQFAQALGRRAPGGWTSEDISVPDEIANGRLIGRGQDYRMFGPDLSLGLVEQLGEDASLLSPEATERTGYLRDDATRVYRPLLTAGNVPPGTHFGNQRNFFNEVEILGANESLSRIVMFAPIPLTADGAEEGLYEWDAGQVQLVSVLPNGSPARFPLLGDQNIDVRHAISTDGNRVVWSTGIGQEAHLYVRDLVRGETQQVDHVQGIAEPETGGARFQLANADASKIFFTDPARLTADSTAGGPGHPDLYEYDAGTGALRDLTIDPTPGESASVIGTVLGASEDGEYVYFVANGALTGGTSGTCVEAKVEGVAPPPGASCTLYVAHQHSVSPVALLSNGDSPDWESLTPGSDLGEITARVSPNGRYVAFMSERPLTGFDNTDANSGRADEEVFLYDSSASRLTCASCRPTGERPEGVFDSGEVTSVLVVDRRAIWAGRWLAASIPGWTPLDRNRALYQSRYLSDQGRLFFDSATPLAPGDANGKEDVYEYEPDGTAGCADAAGCIGLISSGTSGDETAFLDASATGDDVFFATTARLAQQDFDTSYDLYDAHVCSATEPCLPSLPPPSQPCLAEETCKTPPMSRGLLPGPASEAVLGEGNIRTSPRPPLSSKQARERRLAKALRACHHHRNKRRRRVCEKHARARFGAIRLPSQRHGGARTR